LNDVRDEIGKQAEQGVDFMTLHDGVTERAARLAAGPDNEAGRILGIVSRGGAILGRWMRQHRQENPLLAHFDEVLALCASQNVTISLGDGLRPGAGADAGDVAQWVEVVTLAECTVAAHAAGVQVMIEGPGHVPLNLIQSQIQGIKRLCFNAPLYVLGPLVTDSAGGHDHISAAIGGALAGFYGADFLCYVTPAEHLTLPGPEDVRLGVMASRIAAHSAEVALGRPLAVARDRDISLARKALDWDAIARLALDPKTVAERRHAHKHERECAMCGKFCAIKMLED
jgi:phosphomethylpyrimidine synthase